MSTYPARIVAIVQARLGSQRFPRKILADLSGRSVLMHVYERACQIQGVDGVVVIVPWDDYAEIHRAVPTVHVLAFNGLDEADVLGRYVLAARQERAEIVMRVTADCPILNPVVAGEVLDLFYTSQPFCDFASNDTAISGYPDGWDCAVFSRAALEIAASEAIDPADREHIECWFKRPGNGMGCVTLYNPESWEGPTKLSIDEPSDLDRVRRWLREARGEPNNGEHERSNREVARRHV